MDKRNLLSVNKTYCYVNYIIENLVYFTEDTGFHPLMIMLDPTAILGSIGFPRRRKVDEIIILTIINLL